jgi:hypothetical protein
MGSPYLSVASQIEAHDVRLLSKQQANRELPAPTGQVYHQSPPVVTKGGALRLWDARSPRFHTTASTTHHSASSTAPAG